MRQEMHEGAAGVTKPRLRHRPAWRARRHGYLTESPSARRLTDYPLTLAAGHDHVAALSDALSQFGRTARIGIEEMNELEDAASADILTEICRGVDKWLWFVEAHEQVGQEEVITGARVTRRG
jgi:hypothetical protein